MLDIFGLEKLHKETIKKINECKDPKLQEHCKELLLTFWFGKKEGA